MGPLRKKGRGAGGGKTEALAPGEELPGISPELDNNKVRSVTMNGRKESITKSSSSASAAFESLNAASRFGLSVRVSNQRKSEPTSSENTSRLRDLMSSSFGPRSDTKERRFHDAAAPRSTSSTTRSSSLCKGFNGQTVSSRSTTKEVVEDKLAHRSVRWESVQPRSVHKVAVRELDRGRGVQSERSTPRAISAPSADIVLDLKGYALSRGSSPRVTPAASMMVDRRDTSVDGGLNPQAHVSDVVSSSGGNVVSGRWALANRGMLDHQRTETSRQSTQQIQAQSLEMEAVHLTSEESMSRANFHQSDISGKSASWSYNADSVFDHREHTVKGRSTLAQVSSPTSPMDQGYDDSGKTTPKFFSANLVMGTGEPDTSGTMTPISKQLTVDHKEQQEMTLQRSTERELSVNVTKEGNPSPGSLLGQSEHDEKYYTTKASSSLSSDLALAIRERHKKSPLFSDVSRDESLRKSLSGMLGRSACNCVSGRSSVATSPDRSHLKISPRETPSPQLAALKSAIFTKENVDQVTSQNVTKSPALEHTCNRDRHCEAASSERFQNVFHGRLSRLEGKVSQIAAELRETKALLEENNRICSNALFVDLQTKVANIERALTSGLGDMISAPQPEGEGVRDHEVLGTKPISGSTESHRHSAASNGEIAGHMRAVFGGEDLKERSSLQQRLLNSRPSLHEKLIGNRADLYEKLKHNRELLCNKLATLGGRDRVSAGNCDEGAMVAAEFLLSLDEAHKLGGQAGDDSMVQAKTHVDLVKPSLSISAVKNQYMDFALEQLRSSGSYETQNTASGNSSLFVRSSSIANTPTSLMEKNSAGGAPKFSNWKNPEVTSSGKLSNKMSSKNHPSTHHNDQNEGLVNCVWREGQDISVKGTVQVSGELKPGGDSSEVEADNPQIQINEGSQTMEATVLQSNTLESLTCDEDPLSDDEADQDYCLPLGALESPTGARSQEPTFDEEPEESLHSIGDKTAIAGWFVKEGEGIAFAHDDGSCSYYDVPNMEEKARYSGPKNVSKGEWGDCWVIRASGSDGCSRQYFIAAAAGGARNAAAFCSWDLYDRTIAAYHCDSAPPTSSSPGFFTVDSPEHAGFSHPGLEPNRRSFLDTWAQNRNTSGVPAKASLWWYRPCGALVASAGTCLNTVSLYDIRDGECVMKWDTKNTVASMDFSSPVQWRTSSRLVVVEDEGLSLWDVEGMEGQCLHNVNLVGKQPRALHVHNMDAECNGGVRQRLSSSEQHNDGVLCTNEAVNVLDFRVPAGIAMKIPTFGEQVYSVFTNGDMVLAGTGNVKIKPQTEVLRGGTENVKPSVTTQCCKVNQWSIREGKPMNVYALPEGEGKTSHAAINQVWGDARSVMALNGNGLYIFNADQGMELQDVICADNSALQTFDYANSRLLLVSRDRPPLWRNWP